MANGLTDLQAAVANLQAMQTTVINELQALQNAAGDPDATVEELAQQINTSVAAIQAAIPQPAPGSNAAASSATSAGPAVNATASGTANTTP